MESQSFLSPDTDTADTDSELETTQQFQLKSSSDEIISSNLETDTADTESEVETQRKNSKICDSGLKKIIILSNEVIVPPSVTAKTIVERMRELNPNISIHSPDKQPIRKVTKKPQMKSKLSAPLAISGIIGIDKMLAPRKPDKTPKSVLEKTCTLKAKSIHTRFATKTGDEIENGVANLRETGGNFELSQYASNGGSQQSLDIRSVLPSSSRSHIEVMDHENEVSDSRAPISVQNSSGNIEMTPDASNKLILNKIDMLQRTMDKGFSKLSKCGDNDYNDIKSLIPTHSVQQFDSLDVVLREDKYLFQKMRRFLQKYKSSATTKNIYGSVLRRIVDDHVILSYNYSGVKGKFRLAEHAIVDIIFDIYRPADHRIFESDMRQTIEFAKNRYYNGEYQKKKQREPKE